VDSKSLVGTFDAIRIVDAQTALAIHRQRPTMTASFSQARLANSSLFRPSPASSTLPLLIAGLLLVATAVAVAGALVARRPDLVRSAIRGLAAARARK
jgi:hypothetical protein